MITPEEARSDVRKMSAFVAQNEWLVAKWARRCATPGTAVWDDVMQAGRLGVVHAAKMWDPTKGANFSTYASYKVRQLVQRELVTAWNDIRVPVHIHTDARRFRRGGRDPKALRAAGLDRSPCRSMDAPFAPGTDNSSCWHDLLRSTEGAPDDVADRRRQLAALAAALGQGRAADMVRRRLAGDTLLEIGETYGLTRERVRQLIDDKLKALAAGRSEEDRPHTSCMARNARFTEMLRGGASAFDVAATTDVPMHTLAPLLSRLRREASIPSTREAKREAKDVVLASLLQSGAGTAKIAADLGISCGSVRRRIRELAGRRGDVCLTGSERAKEERQRRIEEMRTLAAQGVPATEIATRFGLSSHHASKLVSTARQGRFADRFARCTELRAAGHAWAQVADILGMKERSVEEWYQRQARAAPSARADASAEWATIIDA